jgi:hypothetical protein
VTARIQFTIAHGRGPARVASERRLAAPGASHMCHAAGARVVGGLHIAVQVEQWDGPVVSSVEWMRARRQEAADGIKPLTAEGWWTHASARLRSCTVWERGWDGHGNQ